MGVEQKKLRILNKLADYGANTEKKITALTYPEIMRICRASKALAFSDMELMLDLQEAIKGRRTIAFLLGTDKESEDGNSGRKNGNDRESDSGELDGDREASGLEGLYFGDAGGDDSEHRDESGA